MINFIKIELLSPNKKKALPVRDEQIFGGQCVGWLSDIEGNSFRTSSPSNVLLAELKVDSSFVLIPVLCDVCCYLVYIGNGDQRWDGYS